MCILMYRSQRKRIDDYKGKSSNMNIKLHTNSKGSQEDGDIIMEDCLAYGQISAHTGGLNISNPSQRQTDNPGVYEAI